MAEDTVVTEGEPFITAGELALGVLEDVELADARRMMLADRAFAEAVEWWETRLGAMAEAAACIAGSGSKIAAMRVSGRSWMLRRCSCPIIPHPMMP